MLDFLNFGIRPLLPVIINLEHLAYRLKKKKTTRVNEK